LENAQLEINDLHPLRKYSIRHVFPWLKKIFGTPKIAQNNNNY